jgi:hypothetical protein
VSNPENHDDYHNIIPSIPIRHHKNVKKLVPDLNNITKTKTNPFLKLFPKNDTSTVCEYNPFSKNECIKKAIDEMHITVKIDLNGALGSNCKENVDCSDSSFCCSNKICRRGTVCMLGTKQNGNNCNNNYECINRCCNN